MNEILAFLSENWYVIIAFIVLIVVTIINKNKVREWLRFAVTEAEKELKTGTGQLKLRSVYDAFIKKFPIISSIIPFSIFSKMVDLALEWMNEQLLKNEAIKNFVEQNL